MSDKDLSGWQDVYEELYSVLGLEGTLKFHEAFGGQTLMFPIHLYQRSYVIEQVQHEYANGESVKILAHKWGYSVRSIYEFIK